MEIPFFLDDLSIMSGNDVNDDQPKQEKCEA